MNRRLIRVGGPILGVLILIYVINAGVDRFQADLKEAGDADRVATLAAAEAAAEATAEAASETETSAETPAAADSTEGEAIAQVVHFRQPSHRAIVPPTFVVKMGALGLTVEPSGEINPDAGHMHILVDTDYTAPGEIILTDEQHLHFGDGSVETELTLSPGAHTLRLQFADGAHTALEGEQFQDMITVIVEEGAPAQSVRFAQPADDATVSSPLNVVMAATGLVVEPSGAINEGAGHFHILVDTDFVAAGQIIPTDDQHLHYGKGQLTTSFELTPGEHTLRLQFADGAHKALEGEQFQDMITVIVEEGAPAQSVRFAQPVDDATVSSPLNVVMAATGLVVEPSGAINEGAGHFHILVDTDFVAAGQIIPTDEQHLHYGKGQLTASFELTPGEHTLRLQFADGAHTALEGEQFQDMITVIVEEGAAAPSVRIAQPVDGATVSSPLEVVMAATGLVVEPSGAINEGAGHFHILVDTDFVAAGLIIPTDDQHLHYGKGQLTASLELTPGEHTLRLQFADGAHTALEGDAYRDQITVVVSGEAQAESAGSEQAPTASVTEETKELAIATMTTVGCNTCHVTPGLPNIDSGMLGPDQSNLGTVAGSRREGYTAEEYIRESILSPNEFIVEECPLGQCLQVMPQNYGELLKEEELNAMVAYLLSLQLEQ